MNDREKVRAEIAGRLLAQLMSSPPATSMRPTELTDCAVWWTNFLMDSLARMPEKEIQRTV